MSDEELASWYVIKCEIMMGINCQKPYKTCKDCILDWLQSEAEAEAEREKDIPIQIEQNKHKAHHCKLCGNYIEEDNLSVCDKCASEYRI